MPLLSSSSSSVPACEPVPDAFAAGNRASRQPRSAGFIDAPLREPPGQRVWLCLDQMPPARASLLVSGKLSIGSLTLVAAGISAIGIIAHGDGPWRLIFPFLCLLAVVRIVASLAGPPDSAAARRPELSLLLGSDGCCCVREFQFARGFGGEADTMVPATFEFGWHNARQARIRCRLAGGACLEWRVYRVRLSEHDWRQLCRWLMWQTRGAVRP